MESAAPTTKKANWIRGNVPRRRQSSPCFLWKLLCLICKVQMCLGDISTSITLCKCRPWGRGAPVSHSGPLIGCVWVMTGQGSSTGLGDSSPPARFDEGVGRETGAKWEMGRSASVSTVGPAQLPAHLQAGSSWTWDATAAVGNRKTELRASCCWAVN